MGMEKGVCVWDNHFTITIALVSLLHLAGFMVLCLCSGVFFLELVPFLSSLEFIACQGEAFSFYYLFPQCQVIYYLIYWAFEHYPSRLRVG